MIYSVYSILDRKAQAYSRLMFFVNDDMARRGVADLMANPVDDPMTKYPEDFDLYRVGEFDTSVGMLAGGPTPVLVCCFSDYALKEE